MHYHNILMANRSPDDWERDEDGCWQPQACECTSRRSSYLTDNAAPRFKKPEACASSTTSTLGEFDEDNDWSQPQEQVSGIDGDSTEGGSLTGYDNQQLSRPSISMMIEGIGYKLMNTNEPSWRPRRLVESYDAYQSQFVALKKEHAFGG